MFANSQLSRETGPTWQTDTACELTVIQYALTSGRDTSMLVWFCLADLQQGQSILQGQCTLEVSTTVMMADGNTIPGENSFLRRKGLTARQFKQECQGSMPPPGGVCGGLNFSAISSVALKCCGYLWTFEGLKLRMPFCILPPAGKGW